MGSVYKRGSIFWIQYYKHGRCYRETTRSARESDAKRLLRKREGEISEGKLPGVYFDKVRFDDLAEDFLNDYRVNSKDTTRAEYSMEHLKAMFEGMRVTDIDTPRIKIYIRKRLEADEVTNATVNRELSALKRMLNLGVQQTPPKVDRVPHIPMLKENNTRKGFFEHAEFLALRDDLKGFATFGYKSGWRISEISDLQWSQVDLNNGIVRLEPGEAKNDEARTYYFSVDMELREIFAKQWELRGKNGKLLPFVFLNEKGDGKVKRFDKAWKRACKKAGIGVRLFHDFRRTAVRNMVRAGIPERVAMMISGHKTRSVFERYNIVSDADLRLAAQRQAEYLRAQTSTISSTVHDLEARRGALSD
jgi:integrase